MRRDRREFLTTTAGMAAVGAAAGADVLGVSGAEQTQATRLGKTKHTRFAVNVEMWWRKLPFLKRLQEAAKLGFPGVEFWPWQNKDITAIAQMCRKLHLQVAQFTAWGFRPGLNDPANHPKFVQAIEEGCKVAHRLDCRKMTVVGGDDIRGVSQEQMHKNIIAGLKKAAPIAEKNKVMLILEPMNIRVDHKGHCLYGSEPAIRIVEAVGSPFVKINWDLYHMQITEGDLCGHLKDGFDSIGYVQLADHPGRNEPGTGEIYYPRVLKELHKLGYRGFVGLECRPKGNEIEAARAVHQADEW